MVRKRRSRALKGELRPTCFETTLELAATSTQKFPVIDVLDEQHQDELGE